MNSARRPASTSSQRRRLSPDCEAKAGERHYSGAVTLPASAGGAHLPIRMPSRKQLEATSKENP